MKSEDKLLGTYPNVMPQSQRDKRLAEIREAKKAICDDASKKEDGAWLNEWYPLEREEKELWRDYPDLPPDEPIVVEKVHSGGGACPTQFFGETPDGKEVYARYRHGYLSVEVDREWVFGKQLDWGDDEDHTMEHYLKMWDGDEERAKQSFDSHEMVLKLSGGYNSYHGSISYEELIEATKGWLVWPEIDW